MAMNPYAFAMLQGALDKQDERAQGTGQKGVGSTQQGLSLVPSVPQGNGADPSMPADNLGGTLNVGGAPQQSTGMQSGKMQGAMQGGQMGGVWGAIIGAALAKQQEAQDAENSKRMNKANNAASFAARLGYPMDNYRAMAGRKPDEPHMTPGGEFTQQAMPGAFGRRGKGAFG